MHKPSANKDEKAQLKTITNRHIAWLTALRYAMRSKKEWEATYDSISDKTNFK
jgi:putative membrane protein